MQRRSVLKRSLALATVALAGCSGDGSEDDEPTETPTDEPASGDEPTATDTMGAATATPGTETTVEETRTTTGGTTDTRSETPTGGGTTGTPPTESPTPEETPTPTDTATPTPTETETPTPPQAAQSVEVGPGGEFRFNPEEFEVAVGETVRWVWRSGGHNVKPDSIPGDSDWSGSEGGEFNTFSADHEHTHTFETPGTYEYVCKPHESSGMTGSFTVTE